MTMRSMRRWTHQRSVGKGHRRRRCTLAFAAHDASPTLGPVCAARSSTMTCRAAPRKVGRAELVVEIRLAVTRPAREGGGEPRKPSAWNALVSQQSELGDSFKTDVPAVGAQYNPRETDPDESKRTAVGKLDKSTKRARLAPGPEHSECDSA